jgi:hypothetical protein
MKSRLVLVIVVMALLLSAVGIASANIQSPARFVINGGRDINIRSGIGLVQFSFGGAAVNLPNAAIVCNASAGSTFTYRLATAAGLGSAFPNWGIEPTTRQALSLPAFNPDPKFNRFVAGRFANIPAHQTRTGLFLIQASGPAGAKGTIQCLLVDGTTVRDLNNPLAGSTIYAAAVANVNVVGRGRH